jgi:hypothetical protein
MRMKPRRHVSSDRPVDDPLSVRDKIDRDLARRIAAWAAFHTACPLAGCRRNRRCLKPGHCRACSDRPLTEEERLAIRGQIDSMAEGDNREAIREHLAALADWPRLDGPRTPDVAAGPVGDLYE